MAVICAYRMTHDTGFAPCVDNGLFSLACCKGGQIRKGKVINTNIRYWIGSKKDEFDYTKDDVYVLGVYKGRFLYLARITKTVEMKDYFCKGSEYSKRLDQIYDWTEGEIVRNNHLKEEGIHTNKDDMIRDWAGRYVLLSDDYIYLGENSVENAKILSGVPAGVGYKKTVGKEADEIVEECKQCRDRCTDKPSESIEDKCKSGRNCSRQKRTKGKGSCM